VPFDELDCLDGLGSPALQTDAVRLCWVGVDVATAPLATLEEPRGDLRRRLGGWAGWAGWPRDTIPALSYQIGWCLHYWLTLLMATLSQTR
jgi:hypothetical protein